MNKVIVSIILLAISLALIIGAVIPVANEIKTTGQTTFDAIKNVNNSIKP